MTSTHATMNPAQEGVRRAVQITRAITHARDEVEAARIALNNLLHVQLFEASDIVERELIRKLMSQLVRADESLDEQKTAAIDAICAGLGAARCLECGISLETREYRGDEELCTACFEQAAAEYLAETSEGDDNA